jgi:hypothetical protein
MSRVRLCDSREVTPDDESPRIYSLWQLMREFDAAELLRLIWLLESSATMMETASEGDASQRGRHSASAYTSTLEKIRMVLAFAKKQEFMDCFGSMSFLESHLSHYKTDADTSTLVAALRQARDALILATGMRKFLAVSSQRAGFVDQDALFGSVVHGAFPSARDDIREIGNCLAAECNTAAVFHMMRAVEWGLRGLAADLGLLRLSRHRKSGKVKYTPLAFSQWEDILNQLHARVERRVTKLRPGLAKQRLEEFYYPALQDIRGIRDAWRNHVSHTRRTYTSTDADAIYEHVKRLLTTLASRISERNKPKLGIVK